MGGFSLWHWLIVGIVILLLFGKGRFSSMMGDVASGLKSFKKGMAEDDEVPPGQRTITRDATPRETNLEANPPSTTAPERDEAGRL